MKPSDKIIVMLLVLCSMAFTYVVAIEHLGKISRLEERIEQLEQKK